MSPFPCNLQWFCLASVKILQSDWKFLCVCKEVKIDQFAITWICHQFCEWSIIGETTAASIASGDQVWSAGRWLGQWSESNLQINHFTDDLPDGQRPLSQGVSRSTWERFPIGRQPWRYVADFPAVFSWVEQSTTLDHHRDEIDATQSSFSSLLAAFDACNQFDQNWVRVV